MARGLGITLVVTGHMVKVKESSGNGQVVVKR